MEKDSKKVIMAVLIEELSHEAQRLNIEEKTRADVYQSLEGKLVAWDTAKSSSLELVKSQRNFDRRLLTELATLCIAKLVSNAGDSNSDDVTYELKTLGRMLTSTSPDDSKRLDGISSRLEKVRSTLAVV